MSAPDYLWPTASQMLLLRAALSESDAGRGAFARWCETVDLAGPVDHGSLGLLPLVHANIAPREIAIAGLIAGVRRRSFVETQRAIAAAAETVQLLADAGIRAMVTKGVPLALDYYASPGLRPMADADLVVERRQAFAALDVLNAAGWRPQVEDWAGTRRRYVAVYHGVALRRGLAAEVDLHWRPLHETMPGEVEQQLWSRAVPIAIGGTSALRPDATSLLMHVLLHGLRRNPKAPLRWIPDAIMILNKDRAGIDWDALIECGRRTRTLHRLSLALAYLAAEFDAAIPECAIADARRHRPGLIERLENSLILAEPHGPRPTTGYRTAMVLRMLAGGRGAAIPAVLWQEATRRMRSPRA